MIAERLKTLKNQRKLTNAQLSEMSGVSESTISKILSGQNDSPNLQTLIDLVTAMGGSLDEVVGIKSAENETRHGADETTLSAVEQRVTQTFMQHIERRLVAIYDERIATYRENLAVKDKTIRMLLIALCVALGLFFAQWMIDAFVPTVGWVRY